MTALLFVLWLTREVGFPEILKESDVENPIGVRGFAHERRLDRHQLRDCVACADYIDAVNEEWASPINGRPGCINLCPKGLLGQTLS